MTDFKLPQEEERKSPALTGDETTDNEIAHVNQNRYEVLSLIHISEPTRPY